MYLITIRKLKRTITWCVLSRITKVTKNLIESHFFKTWNAVTWAELYLASDESSHCIPLEKCRPLFECSFLWTLSFFNISWRNWDIVVDELILLISSWNITSTRFLVFQNTLEFSLSENEIQWIQQIRGIWQITEAHSGVNVEILSLTSIFLALCWHLYLLHKKLLLNSVKTFKEDSTILHVLLLFDIVFFAVVYI